ncbi:hypothetical protein KCU65_g6402, partial [Aureobasidium melanogenum]
MRNISKYRLRLVAPTDETATKEKDTTDILPPPYEEYPQAEGAVILPSSVPLNYPVFALKRCLIWRMAIDWGLQRHVPKLERPSDIEYSTFEKKCTIFGATLGDRWVDLQRAERYLWTWVFEPASRMGVEKSKQKLKLQLDMISGLCFTSADRHTLIVQLTDLMGISDLLEFFLFSVQRASRLSPKRITSCRNAMMLVRLVLDSRILIDLVTNPGSTFAKKLKAKCADLHKKNFSWLLELEYIRLDESVKARATDIYSKDTLSGRWRETEMLLRECMRPSAALKDSSRTLSTMYEVDSSYFKPDADLRQQPEFNLRPWRAHKNLLPTNVVCGPIAWVNHDTISWDKLETGGIPKE